MPSYQSVAEFRALTVMSEEDVDFLQEQFPGFLALMLEAHSSWISSRLRKRYHIPFASPVAPVVQLWLTQMVTPVAYAKRGWAGAGNDIEEITAAAVRAREEVLEAANSETGLFDLPLIEGQDASAISKSPTRSYAEQSPYVGFSRQRETGRDEDRNGGGTFL